jgi:hypothetical protein
MIFEPAPLAAPAFAAAPRAACEVCNASVGELRRGRCWGCYTRWVEARPVGIGARCVTCNEKRRRVLKQVELYGNWKPMCFNCAGQVLGLEPMPATISDLKKLVSRERRDGDRRVGKSDTRVYMYERRVGDRRMGRDAELSIDDDMIIEITIDEADLPPPLVASSAAEGSGPTATSTDDPDVDFESDLTAIRTLVAELRPE